MSQENSHWSLQASRPSKMATHMFRQLRKSSAVLNLMRRQNIRLVSSCGPRMIFAARRYDQQPCVLQSSVLARQALLGLRMFADASPTVSVEDRVLNVVKLFDVEPEKVRDLKSSLIFRSNSPSIFARL